MNKTMLIGNLGRDPEITVMKNGEKVANLSIATTKRWVDKKTGNKASHTEWHRVVLFGPRAQTAESYLKSGSHVYIEGELRTRKWQDKDQKVRDTTEIVGLHMEFLGPAPTPAHTETARSDADMNAGSDMPQGLPETEEDGMDMDIPF